MLRATAVKQPVSRGDMLGATAVRQPVTRGDVESYNSQAASEQERCWELQQSGSQ